MHMKKVIKTIASFTVKFVISFVLFFALMCIKAVNSYGQVVTKQGTTFVIAKEKSNASKEAKKSKYTIKIDGKTYPLYIGPRGGVYYIKGDKKCYNVPQEVKDAVKKG